MGEWENGRSGVVCKFVRFGTWQQVAQHVWFAAVTGASPCRSRKAFTLANTLSAPIDGRPSELMDPPQRGSGTHTLPCHIPPSMVKTLPLCGSFSTVPTTAKPAPSSYENSRSEPSLSKPAALPRSLRNARPMARTGGPTASCGTAGVANRSGWARAHLKRGRDAEYAHTYISGGRISARVGRTRFSSWQSCSAMLRSRPRLIASTANALPARPSPTLTVVRCISLSPANSSGNQSGDFNLASAVIHMNRNAGVLRAKGNHFHT
jgi:hypothetical protein